MATVNALTIDVEEYFQTPPFAGSFPRSTWETAECRTDGNIERILALLAEYNVRATFFMLGWIAERFPECVRSIVANGHELASYGYQRTRTLELGDGPFLADIRLAKAVLEDISGVVVNGYRPPGYPIWAENAWAYDCIAVAGYRYFANAAGRMDARSPGDRAAHEVRPGLLQVPAASIRAFGGNWAAGAGTAFQAIPYWLLGRLLKQVGSTSRPTFAFDLPAWAFDPHMARLARESGRSLSLTGRDTGQLESKIRRMLADFQWDRVDQLFLPAVGAA